MIRPAVGTILTRAAMAAASLLLVALAARALGLAGVGQMSLLLLCITFIVLLSGVAGSGLVYLEPRHGTRTLRLLAYAWSAASCLAAYPIVSALKLAPEGLAAHACALAFIESVSVTHLNLLLGRERYSAFNALQLLRAVLLLAAFAMLIRQEGAAVMDYVWAIGIAQTATAVLSALLLARHPGQRSDAWMAAVALLRQGLPAQAANGLQLLTYRLSYFLVERFQGAALLGLWSITNQLSESAWLAPKSLGTVLYARVSNVQERERQRDLTLSVLKLSVALAALAAALLIALPDAVYRWAFGPAVAGVRWMVALLVPGLLAMAASQALSHFLSGIGAVRHNTVASGIGLGITVAGGFALIPSQGLHGAAITASCAYCASFLYQAFLFRRMTGARWKHCLPDAQDARRLGGLWRRMMGQ
jgi:O-antigen/teichoic acid export membrane protein